MQLRLVCNDFSGKTLLNNEICQPVVVFYFDNVAHIRAQRLRRPAGYLLLRHGMPSIACLITSNPLSPAAHATHSTPVKTEETYPKTYWPGESDFAPWNSRSNARGCISTLYWRAADGARRIAPSAYARHLVSLRTILRPTPESAGRDSGQLCGFARPTRLPGPVTRSPRHRTNLLGNLAFSPLVRRTKALKAAEAKQLAQRCRKVIGPFHPNSTPAHCSFSTPRKPTPPTSPLTVEPRPEQRRRSQPRLQRANSYLQPCHSSVYSGGAASRLPGAGAGTLWVVLVGLGGGVLAWTARRLRNRPEARRGASRIAEGLADGDDPSGQLRFPSSRGPQGCGSSGFQLLLDSRHPLAGERTAPPAEDGGGHGHGGDADADPGPGAEQLRGRAEVRAFKARLRAPTCLTFMTKALAV